MTRASALFGASACLALGVAVTMLVAGDGVHVEGLTGLPALLPRWGHAAVWLLLSAALLTACLRGGWSRVSAALAGGAGLLYVALLVVVLTS